MAATYGRRVVVGITTDFIGKPGYMTWDDVRRISEHHEIANHSRAHEHLNDYSKIELIEELSGANSVIKREIGTCPRTYLPTYNYRSKLLDEVCYELDLAILDPVIIMYNKTP
jgi:peptidoglycan/xylan/chitin deacetylase (PgdA/CDA1 family)